MTVGRHLRSGRARGVVPGALVAALLLWSCAGEPDVGSEVAADDPPVEEVDEVEEDDDVEEPEPVVEDPEPPTPTAQRPRGTPVRVQIDAIGVDADLVALGLADDGTMEVPDFGLASWYDEGPPPGHPGPAVVAAHVDSRSGPDVFYRLRELEPDDLVVVVYDSGDEARFEVVRSEQTDKDELPGDDIWPITNEPLLALITCGGEFDRSVRHYRDNIVVYTVPATDQPVVLAG